MSNDIGTTSYSFELKLDFKPLEKHRKFDGFEEWENSTVTIILEANPKPTAGNWTCVDGITLPIGGSIDNFTSSNILDGNQENEYLISLFLVMDPDFHSKLHIH